MRGEGGEVGVRRSQTSHGSQRSGTSTIFMAPIRRLDDLGSFLEHGCTVLLLHPLGWSWSKFFIVRLFLARPV